MVTMVDVGLIEANSRILKRIEDNDNVECEMKPLHSNAIPSWMRCMPAMGDNDGIILWNPYACVCWAPVAIGRRHNCPIQLPAGKKDIQLAAAGSLTKPYRTPFIAVYMDAID